VVDYVIDSLLDIGISPMFTTTFMPGDMAAGERTVFSTRGRISLPKDWQAWRNWWPTAHVTPSTATASKS
jgi:hypothetical protein